MSGEGKFLAVRSPGTYGATEDRHSSLDLPSGRSKKSSPEQGSSKGYLADIGSGELPVLLKAFKFVAFVVTGSRTTNERNCRTLLHDVLLAASLLYCLIWRLFVTSRSSSPLMWTIFIALDLGICLFALRYTRSLFHFREERAVRKQVVEWLVQDVITRTSAPKAVWMEVRIAAGICFCSLLLCGLTTSFGCLFDTTYLHAAFSSSPVPERNLGLHPSWGVRVFEVCVFLVGFQSACGVSSFALVTLLHRVRIRSAFRALRRGSTSVNEAIERCVSVDELLSTFSEEHTLNASSIVVCSFLKLILGGIAIANDTKIDALSLFASSSTKDLIYPALMDAVLSPGLLLCLCLGPAAAVNQCCSILKTNCARFIIKYRSIATKDEVATLKLFMDFIKNSDMGLRVSGFKVDVKNAWQMIIITASTLYTAFTIALRNEQEAK